MALVREGSMVRVYLDGNREPEISGTLEIDGNQAAHQFFLGGRSDNQFNFEGRLDEVAFYDRALSPEEIAQHYEASDMQPPSEVTSIGPVSSPLDPATSLNRLHLREGFHAELMVSEPLVMDPVAIDWDASGNLWVVEMADYPLGMDGEEEPGGRIRVISDRDGDGDYDHQSLFADDLNFPTGLLTWREGVLVTAAPDILFLKDTDGDGKADHRQVLVTGLTTGNQQLRANGLRWGLDGWVYCAAGGHHGRYGVGNQLKTSLGSVLVGARDFRFRPDTGELEPVSGPSQNGRNRDDWGRWYGTQNSRALWHYVLQDKYLRRNDLVAYPSPTQLVVTPLNPRVFP
ncbi:MAG: PVC-type heme-binding CxxCH protein, partial [Limisphaerales bacterium]